MGSLQDTLRGKHLLVTGVTGFVGKVWLVMLLDRFPDIGRVTVLVRGKRGETARQRMHRIAERSPAFRPLRARLNHGIHGLLDAKLRVLEGDVTRPRCGLDEPTLASLRDVDAVVHFAGLTDFEPDPLQAVAINTRGGENAADVAARTRARRFLHVSTAFVAGNVSGEIAERIDPGVAPNGTRFDPHAELAELERLDAHLHTRRERVDAAMDRARRLGWPNIYTYTKGLSEHLHALRDDLALTIVRPAVVESARRYPFVGWNEGINTSGPLVWLLSSWFRSFPSKPHNRFDVVPVDTVARGTTLVLTAMLRDEAETVYHLGSSATNPLTFERAIDLTALASRQMASKPSAPALDRLLVKYLDAVPRDGDTDPFPSLETLRWSAQKAREVLRSVKTEGRLPPAAQRSWGKRFDERIKGLSMDFRKVDRTLASIEDMLESYRPFIHDNDYVFRIDHVLRLDAALGASEREEHGFDIGDLCWRDYWLRVHVPGLEKWCLPLLRGEKVPDDPPMQRRAATSDAPPAPSREMTEERARPQPMGGGASLHHPMQAARLEE